MRIFQRLLPGKKDLRKKERKNSKTLAFKRSPNFYGEFNTFPAVSVILIGLSVILLATALLTNENDFTTAVLVVVALANFLTALIISAFTETKGINPLFSSMLYPPLIISRAKFFSELNVFGDACFIPKEVAGSDDTIQFNPTGEYKGFDYKKEMFSTDTKKTAGIFTTPSSESLMLCLKNDYSLSLLHYEEETSDLTEELKEITKEIFCESFPLCEDVTLTQNGDEMIFSLKAFALTDGCRIVRDESPKCCTASPCPICSLIAAATAEYSGKIVSVSAVRPDFKKGDLTVILKVLSHQPTGEGHGSLN
ncbi:hypothetical protein J2128_001047 [Methanomicrobium sp. W14]|uniref:hypothetical protein n=1 Tax=Methanomicrobium sp. W14 TaxID=2817839 RepID=UPI001AE732CC|nr:hypothetical protein [Methanomicrobium sp. W14]MBP2133126.1 hypothetical protein [Methanomicrobium sp. W14]